ncbi:Low molecular weight protein-tyrosine-phosphatase wzb [uncultured Roseburia sp.]|uniref:Phosphotyrosine protein phosphatase n=1 Tax=Brotonthovivens ammoniilytica TaxID=2981725 RepID=A0ABT2TI44_9FIRM|nr:phosphotyrosine protein phosphatase [Brotonthovivens ammoniilytica]MCU6761850.1 phosphotyrosine protein phosphatase [Brotonthovivens ammoniilytica]SCI48496.1 Low molecular weight protein-tyrosine-phosphatase wzb [uncultured Roseburia sp.]
MKTFNRIIFVAKSGNCRAPMAMELLKAQLLSHPVQIDARGLVVLFPEPLNQKAEAVMISNGIKLENYRSSQLEGEDFSEETLILAMDSEIREKLLTLFPDAVNVYVLSEAAGDELEVMDPYGGDLMTYGLCFESMGRTIKKLAAVLNEGVFFRQEKSDE